MDLTNMRQNGVRSLAIHCRCGRQVIMNVDAYPGHLAVKSFEWRLVCGQCGGRDVEARPNWREAPNMPDWRQGSEMTHGK